MLSDLVMFVSGMFVGALIMLNVVLLDAQDVFCADGEKMIWSTERNIFCKPVD